MPAANLQVVVTGVNELRRDLNPAHFRAAVQQGLENAAEEIVEIVRGNSPQSDGTFQDSLTAKVSGDVLEVYSTDRPLKVLALEYGSRPHIVGISHLEAWASVEDARRLQQFIADNGTAAVGMFSESEDEADDALLESVVEALENYVEGIEIAEFVRGGKVQKQTRLGSGRFSFKIKSRKRR